jgi:hypothetical protein
MYTLLLRIYTCTTDERREDNSEGGGFVLLLSKVSEHGHAGCRRRPQLPLTSPQYHNALQCRRDAPRLANTQLTPATSLPLKRWMSFRNGCKAALARSLSLLLLAYFCHATVRALRYRVCSAWMSPTRMFLAGRTSAEGLRSTCTFPTACMSWHLFVELVVAFPGATFDIQTCGLRHSRMEQTVPTTASPERTVRHLQ